MIEYENHRIIVSVSGGKDSTAMCLNLLENGYSTSDFERVFIDTGWENHQTYEYLSYLEKTVGPITYLRPDVDKPAQWSDRIDEIESLLGFTSPMVRLFYKNKIFPNGRVKYCTRLLKVETIAKYLKSFDEDVINLVGIRAEESARRASMTEWEYSDKYECDTHRPLLHWTESDVIDIHTRFNVLPNNLYLTGARRVGCYPCIYASKQDVRQLDADRIRIISMIESDLNASFFKTKTITEAYNWSLTARGGTQYMLFDGLPKPCEKWGLCGI